MIRVILPQHLRSLAGIEGELQLDLSGPVTVLAVLEQIEIQFPVLKGTIREPQHKRRRAFVRFFACQEDLSDCPTSTVLPPPVLSGEEPFMIIGAMAGG